MPSTLRTANPLHVAASSASLTGYSRMTGLLLAFIGLAMVGAPIDGIKGFGGLGELGSLASFPPMVAAVGLGLYLASYTGVRSMRYTLNVAAICLLVVLLSTVVNAQDMATHLFHGRGGFSKLITSSMVVGLGLCLSAVVEPLPPAKTARIIALCVAISALACTIYAIFEFPAKHGHPNAVYTVLNKIFHSGESEINAWNGAVNKKVAFGWDTRLRSLSFEPPAFGNFTGFAWPWLVYGVMIWRGRSRVLAAWLLAAFTVVIIASQSRTAWLMLAANCAVLAGVRILYFNRRADPILAALRVAGPVFALCLVGLAVMKFSLGYSELPHKLVFGASVSDLSRSASQITAMKMFADHPLLGVGFGQFAFHGLAYMPNWGYFSPEIWPDFLFESAPWPATYSVFARLAAETGVIGLLGWTGLWIWLFFRVIRAGTTHLQSDVGLRYLGYPLAMTALGVLVSGIATDTFRLCMMWIALGLSFAFIKSDQGRIPRGG